MAREEAQQEPLRRSAGQRRAAIRRAADAADLAIARLQREVTLWKDRYEQVVAALGDSVVADRIIAMAPALHGMVQGQTVTGVPRLRRNVALHAEAGGLQVSTASASALRRAQKGPRLQSVAVRGSRVGSGLDEDLPTPSREAADEGVDRTGAAGHDVLDAVADDVLPTPSREAAIAAAVGVGHFGGGAALDVTPWERLVLAADGARADGIVLPCLPAVPPAWWKGTGTNLRAEAPVFTPQAGEFKPSELHVGRAASSDWRTSHAEIARSSLSFPSWFSELGVIVSRLTVFVAPTSHRYIVVEVPRLLVARRGVGKLVHPTWGVPDFLVRHCIDDVDIGEALVASGDVAVDIGEALVASDDVKVGVNWTDERCVESWLLDFVTRNWTDHAMAWSLEEVTRLFAEVCEDDSDDPFCDTVFTACMRTARSVCERLVDEGALVLTQGEFSDIELRPRGDVVTPV